MASDKHGPFYPGDLVVTKQGVMYTSMIFNDDGLYGRRDRANDMVDTSGYETICLIIASVRGVGTWKYVLAHDQAGWIPWNACRTVQLLPSQT